MTELHEAISLILSALAVGGFLLFYGVWLFLRYGGESVVVRR